MGLEISGIAQHSGFSSDWQKFGRIWMRRRRLSGFYKLKIVWLATRFFYAVWTIVGIISWWTIAFFFYSFSVEECHSHSSEIRNLCLMKISSETLKKFVIPFQHTYIPKAWQILKLFTRNFNQTSCFWRVLTQWIRYCFFVVYVVCICNVEILVSKCH